jgi:hypothetical protein
MFTSECPNDKCEIPNPIDTNTIEEIGTQTYSLNKAVTVFHNTDLESIIFTAKKGMEDFRYKYDKYDRITNATNIPIYKVINADKHFKSNYQGYIGVAPYQDTEVNKVKSFIYNLKLQGLIDHIVISMYVEMDEGNTS